jgi:hypothetical protein
MSTVSIRAALETALNGMSPAIATAWENVPFTTPAESVPYQVAHIILAEPDNSVYGAEHRELGYMQVRLLYPLNAGSAAALTRAELIRDLFARGVSFQNSGISVIIMRTPEILPATVEDGRYAVVVRVRFYANIFH